MKTSAGNTRTMPGRGGAGPGPRTLRLVQSRAEQYRTVTQKRQQARGSLDEALAKARAEGATFGQLAELTGWTPPTIARHIGSG